MHAIYEDGLTVSTIAVSSSSLIWTRRRRCHLPGGTSDGGLAQSRLSSRPLTPGLRTRARATGAASSRHRHRLDARSAPAWSICSCHYTVWIYPIQGCWLRNEDSRRRTESLNTFQVNIDIHNCQLPMKIRTERAKNSINQARSAVLSIPLNYCIIEPLYCTVILNYCTVIYIKLSYCTVILRYCFENTVLLYWNIELLYCNIELLYCTVILEYCIVITVLWLLYCTLILFFNNEILYCNCTVL